MKSTPYHYAFNSPLIWKDPSGLKGEKERGDKILEQEVITIQEGYLIVQYIYDVTDDAIDAKRTYKLLGQKVVGFDLLGGSAGSSGFKPRTGQTTSSNESGFGGKNGGGFSSLGSGVVNNGGINSFERVVANWSSLSANQAVAVRNALQIIYDKGGKEVIDDLISTGHTISVNFNFTAVQIQNIWNSGENCVNQEYPLLGLSSNIWNQDIIFRNGGKSCKTSISQNGLVNLAIELLYDSKVPGNYYKYLEYGFLKIFNSIEVDRPLLFMVLAHEIKHRFDSYNHHGPLDSENSANKFMIDIYNLFYQDKRKYLEE